MRIHVRKATLADCEALVRFNLALAQETEGRELSPETLAAGVRAVFEDPSRGFYLIAEHDGSPVGGLLITPEWSDWRNAAFWWIQSVYVVPPFRGKGVFKALYQHVKRLARAHPGVCGLRLYVDRDNQQAKGVYERLGLRPSHYDFYEAEWEEAGHDRTQAERLADEVLGLEKGRSV